MACRESRKKMKIAVDINFLIDVSLRYHQFPESTDALKKLLNSGHQIGFPLCGYTTLYYLLSKGLGNKEALVFLDELAKQVTFVNFTRKEQIAARSIGIKDHEDACIAASCLLNGYSLLLTRNIKDFKSSGLKAIEPAVFLQKI